VYNYSDKNSETDGPNLFQGVHLEEDSRTTNCEIGVTGKSAKINERYTLMRGYIKIGPIFINIKF
jgi:hypothetical protein